MDFYFTYVEMWLRVFSNGGKLVFFKLIFADKIQFFSVIDITKCVANLEFVTRKYIVQ